jgi:hypothetical protein
MNVQKIKSTFGRIPSVGLAVMAAFAVVLAMPASASALPSGCRQINVIRAGAFSGGGETYSYSAQYITPSWSACRDINITNVYNNDVPPGDPFEHCAYFRVRFYPTSGGNWATSWVHRCTQIPNSSTIATNVLNGTKYRVETSTLFDFRYTIYD